MPQFRERGRVVTAEQWQPGMPEVIDGVKELRARGKGWERLQEKGGIEATVETRTGTVELKPGDWVVKFPGGEFAVVPSEEFDAKYAAVEEAGR